MSSRAALPEAENHVGPMLLDRGNELPFIEADGKDDLFQIRGARELSNDLLRDVRFKLLVRPEAVDEDTHNKRRGGLLARPFCFHPNRWREATLSPPP